MFILLQSPFPPPLLEYEKVDRGEGKERWEGGQGEREQERSGKCCDSHPLLFLTSQSALRLLLQGEQEE